MQPESKVQSGKDPRARRRALLLAVGLPALWFVVGLAAYGVDLDRPDFVVFDEKHYVRASWAFANGTWLDPAWTDVRPFNWEHPPLGKFWIALAIDAFGAEPPGYRWPSVLHGALGLAGLSVLARRLFRSELAGIVAPALLLLDPMWYLLSRMAMLEIFVAAPMIWAFALAFGSKPWERWGAGAVAGYALAAKYTALFLLPMLLLVLFFRDVRGPADARGVRAVARPLGRALVPGLAVPLGLFVLSYLPFLVEYARQGGLGYMVSHWFFVFGESLTWGATGPDEHPEITPPLLWLPMVRPTWFYVHWGPGQGATQIVHTIYAVGNPVVWWGGLLFALLVLGGPVLRFVMRLRAASAGTGEWRLRVGVQDARAFQTMGLVLLIFLMAYAPFFLLSRATFLYYMGFLVPWLALLAAGGLVWLIGIGREARAAPAPTPPTAQAATEAPAPAEPAAVAPRRRFDVRPWLGPVAAGLFVAAALVVCVYWFPLYSGVGFERATIDRAWSLVPWLDRVPWG